MPAWGQVPRVLPATGAGTARDPGTAAGRHIGPLQPEPFLDAVTGVRMKRGGGGALHVSCNRGVTMH